MLELEVDLGSEHVPGHGRVRVPAPIGSAAGAGLGAGERICAECHSRRQPDVMMRAYVGFTGHVVVLSTHSR